MHETGRSKGLTRRGFIKSLGLGGLAATSIKVPEALATQEETTGKTASVPRRKLGKTGVEVSVLSLGGMFDTINNQLLLKQALNWGVNYWDTAEAYGNGLSEDGFGRFFTRYPDTRKEVFLVTKSHPGAPQALTEALDKSLKRLRTDYVDLYFAHGISNIKETGDATKEWAEQMKKAGKLKFYGFSTHTNMEDCLQATAKLGWIDVVMFTYNFRLMHTDKMKAAVAACVKAGVGLVAMKTQGGGPVKTDSEAELQVAGRFLERGFTDKQARLKAVWENPDIACICSQMPSLTILAANVAAARDLTSLSREDFQLLNQFAAETRTGYCAGCGSICAEAVDGAVPVSDVMRCLMYFRDYGDQDLAREVYAGLSEEARLKLTEVDYARAERRCPQGLPIARLMHEASRVLA
jgi:predicted aldo/keto reductase-like oxidoreductase